MGKRALSSFLDELHLSHWICKAQWILATCIDKNAFLLIKLQVSDCFEAELAELGNYVIIMVKYDFFVVPTKCSS